MKGLLLLAAAAAALPALSGATDPTQTPPEGASNQVAEEDKQDCPVDEDGDLEDPNNLFTCLKTEECCTVDLNPACCASKDTKDQIMDQLELWGPLLGVILVLAIFIWWCRSDESCCDVEKPWLYRCGCKKRPEEYEDWEGKEDDELGSQVSIRSGKSSTTMLVTDDGTAGHEPQELEEAADNLESVLEEEEEFGKAEDAQDEPDEANDDDDEGEEEDEDDDGDDGGEE